MSENILRADSLACAIYSWQKKNEQELDITVGDIVTVLSITADREWVLCVSHAHERGYVPYNYLLGVENSSPFSVTPIVKKNDTESSHSALSSDLTQPTTQPTVVQQQLTHQDLVQPPLMNMELQQPSGLPQRGGNDGGTAPQQEQGEASRVSSGAYESEGSGQSSFSSLGYETDNGNAVCYRVGRVPTKKSSPALDVRVGDLVFAMEEASADALWAFRCADPWSEGFVDKSALETASSLDLQPWFLGKMTREEAESLLLKPDIEIGTFIVRESETTTGFVISIKSLDGSKAIVRHRKCNEVDGQFTAWSQIKFRDIPQLIMYHSNGRELAIAYDKYLTIFSASPKPPVRPPKPDFLKKIVPPVVNSQLNSKLSVVPQAFPSQHFEPPLEPPRLVHQTLRSTSHAQCQSVSQSVGLRPPGPIIENHGQGKPPPGLVQSQRLLGQAPRPMRPLSQFSIANLSMSPAIQNFGSLHSAAQRVDRPPLLSSQTSIDARRHLIRRPSEAPPPPPSSNDRPQLSIAALVTQFEAKQQTNVSTPLPSAQVDQRRLKEPMAPPRKSPIQQRVSEPNTTAARETGAVPKVISGNLAPAKKSAPTPNQDDIRVMEIEDRVMESRLESWRVIRVEKIGSGHYGEVWKAKIKNTKNIVAMKTFYKDRMEEELFLAEAKTMMALRHPNLVKLHGVCSEPENVFMLLDLYNLGSVYDYLSKGRTLSPHEKLNVMKGVLSGMKYLSEEGFVHRDLAARNVLLTDDKAPKVADFGLAQMIKADGRAEHDNQKTPWKWTAPEALCGGNLWTTKSDVWSYGVFCWELYTNCATQPYPAITNSQSLLRYLRAGDRLGRPPECNETIFGIVYQCWEFDYEARVSFEDLWNFLMV